MGDLADTTTLGKFLRIRRGRLTQRGGSRGHSQGLEGG
ncbi:unnamed protein product [[Actinomadura] parvosata subsp. kistnae]|nr:unnamed protein product [Actinomadura parvosata subsp. kistnae]